MLSATQWAWVTGSMDEVRIPFLYHKAATYQFAREQLQSPEMAQSGDTMLAIAALALTEVAYGRCPRLWTIVLTPMTAGSNWRVGRLVETFERHSIGHTRMEYSGPVADTASDDVENASCGCLAGWKHANVRPGSETDCGRASLTSWSTSLDLRRHSSPSYLHPSGTSRPCHRVRRRGMGGGEIRTRKRRGYGKTTRPTSTSTTRYHGASTRPNTYRRSSTKTREAAGRASSPPSSTSAPSSAIDTLTRPWSTGCWSSS